MTDKLQRPDWRGLCEELLADYEQHLYRSVLADRARAALARFGGRPSPAAEGEVARLVGLFSSWADAYPDGVKLDPQWLARAADLLERQAAPVPVAVSERLPGPEDLNDKGECWEWDPASDAWVLLRPNGLIFRPGPWLPAHALPLPQGEVEE